MLDMNIFIVIFDDDDWKSNYFPMGVSLTSVRLATIFD